jgi:hypothetical protein
MITSHILFGPGASLSSVNYARWLAHNSWERGSQAKWRNYRKGVLDDPSRTILRYIQYIKFYPCHLYRTESHRISLFPKYQSGTKYLYTEKRLEHGTFVQRGSGVEAKNRLHCTALHCTALHCTALHCTALHCTALHWKNWKNWKTAETRIALSTGYWFFQTFINWLLTGIIQTKLCYKSY